jgi:very-short-patch-repair endonuclease
MDPVEALTMLGGVATTQELLCCTSRRRLRTAIGAGRVVRVGPRRWAVPGLAEASVAAARLGGVVSHLSAALHWGWKVKFPPTLPCVTVPRRCSGLDKEGVEVHWANLLGEDVCRGVTAPARTVVDCARAYPFDVALAVADSALRSGMSRKELVAVAADSPRTGRRRAIRAAESADRRAANPFESVLRALAIDAGLDVEPQQWVGAVGRVDLMDRGRALVIEAESHEFHSDRASLARDVRRYTALVRLGKRVARLTWEEVMFEQDYVLEVLRDLARLRASSGPPVRDR